MEKTMQAYFKLPLILAPFLMVGCASIGSENSLNPVETEVSSELINRTEVVAIVTSVDVATDLEQKAAHWGYDLKRKEILPELGIYLLAFDCPPGIDPYEASLELERLQPQSTVEVNHKYTLQAPIDLAPVDMTKASKAFRGPLKYADALIEWPEQGCEALIKIGIIDGEVNPEALVKDPSTQIIKRKFLGQRVGKLASLHGTAIADIIAGSGRLKNATIYNASVVGEDEKGIQYSGVEPMLKALNWMVSQDVKVVNISLAGPYNRTLERGIKSAVDKGLIIVAAVGNDGANASPRYPAAFENVIATTAVDSNMQVYENAIQGKHVDVSAPGVEIFVADGQNGRYVSGTSMATPFVSAKIASDIRYANAKSLDEIRMFFKKDSLDLGADGPDTVFGAGLIRANNCQL